MLHFLGPRGRFATQVVVVLAACGTVFAALERHWSEALGLLVLGYVGVLAGAVWGACRSVLRTAEEIEAHQKAIRQQGRKQMQAFNDVADRVDSANRRGKAGGATQTPAPSGGQTTVERRYATVLEQATPVPYSRLLSFLEILAKDATTRRADEAASRQAIEQLRELVEMQHEEIASLHDRLKAVEGLEPAGSAS